MSAKLMGMVWDLDLPHPEQSILLALADHADHDGSRIFPGVDLLAWKTGYSERQIQRILRTLEDSKLLIPATFRTGGRGHITGYELHLENGVKKSPFSRKSAKGDKMSPITPVNGDNTSPIDDTKGDKSSIKGDKSSIKGDISRTENAIQSRQQAAPHEHNLRLTIIEPEEEDCGGGEVIPMQAQVASPPGVTDARSPIAADVPMQPDSASPTLARIANAAGLPATDALLAMLGKHLPRLSERDVLVEVAKAQEWLGEHKGRRMSLRYLDNWLGKAGTTPAPMTATSANARGTEPRENTQAFKIIGGYRVAEVG